MVEEAYTQPKANNMAKSNGARRIHLNFALPDISSSACGRMRLFYYILLRYPCVLRGMGVNRGYRFLPPFGKHFGKHNK